MSKPALTYGKCNEGWICEGGILICHVHDQCLGPAMPCDVAACPYRVEPRPAKTTGLGCIRCATLADGDLPLAAFYAGALAHYMGDLGQFYHIMEANRTGGLRSRLATVPAKSQSRAPSGFRLALRRCSRASSHRLRLAATAKGAGRRVAR